MMRFVLIAAAALCVCSQTAEAKAKKKIISHHKVSNSKPAVNSPIAKEIFGHQTKPSPMQARAIGSYAKGCLAGAVPFPADGPAWQAMRLSRNRTWGHPALIKLLTRFAEEVKKNDEWPGLMVGDLTQPMGGPMAGGHASHQIGLDVDIWLKPMPARTLSKEERETEAPVSMLAASGAAVDPAVWTPNHVKLIKRAASYPQVTRIFVHPAIKKALCDGVPATDDRKWLSKVQPYWGHYYHFHIRMACPPGVGGCENQPARPQGDGCGKEVENWLKSIKAPPKPEPKTPPVQKHPLTMADLPQECTRLAGLDMTTLAAVVPMGEVPLPEHKPVATAQAAKPASAAAPIQASVTAKPHPRGKAKPSISARTPKIVRANAVK